MSTTVTDKGAEVLLHYEIERAKRRREAIPVERLLTVQEKFHAMRERNKEWKQENRELREALLTALMKVEEGDEHDRKWAALIRRRFSLPSA